MSEPLIVSSATCTAFATPIASALRMGSVAFVGPTVSVVTSPPCASVSLSAFSSTYSSLPLASSCTDRSVSRPGIEALGAHHGHGFEQHDDVHDR